MTTTLDAVATPNAQTGKATVEQPSTPAQGAAPKPPSIAAAVNANLQSKPPKGFSGGNTNNLGEIYLQALIYGEVDSWKTTTAARFGGPERTFIVSTRAKEQLLPLDGQGFRFACAENSDALKYAMQFPERAAAAIGWPEWQDIKDRVLMIDDMTQGVKFIVEDNETTDEGKERKDGRQVFKGVNSDLDDLVQSLKRKPMHIIMTALAKVDNSQIANEETIYPDLPKGARSILTADMNYVFFMKKSNRKMLTTASYLTFTKKDDKGKDIAGRREIFARNKLPEVLCGKTPSFLPLEIAPDLGSMWQKIQEARKRG